MTRIIVAVALTVSVFSIGATGQSEDRAAIWAAAVEHHIPGELDAPALTIAGWSNRDITSALQTAVRAIPTTDRDAFLKRAALLHTDIAVLSRGEDGYRLPPSDRVVVQIADGQRSDVQTGTVHWEIARKLLDGVTNAREDAFVLLWYQASSNLIQTWSEYSELEPHLASATRLVGDDARLLLYSATMHEDYAEPRIQSAIQSANVLTTPMAGNGIRPGRLTDMQFYHLQSSEWNAADDQLRKALTLDPSLSEARVRLAHILGNKGRHAEALAELEHATVDRTLSRDLQYDAWLFTGREDEALDRTDRARDAFERAAALVPGAQSPHLALSQLARARGDRAASLDALQPLSLDRSALRSDDPWWQYTRTHDPSGDELLSQVRRAVQTGTVAR